MMTPISAIIITFNEEEKIGRCIDSLKNLADEILVLDSESTDNTVNIAREKGAVVHNQPFLGYIAQKTKAMTMARHDLILNLDADEALDDELNQSIQKIKASTEYKAFSMNRCANYCGKFIRHGLWYPDRKIRLFDRRVVKWGGIDPHEKVIVKKSIPIKHLKGDIFHYTFDSISDHVIQNDRFSTISAQTMFRDGKKTSWLKIILNPVWAFINGYFFRLGFLDGFYGYVIAKNIAHLTLLKHAKLFQLQKNSGA